MISSIAFLTLAAAVQQVPLDLSLEPEEVEPLHVCAVAVSRKGQLVAIGDSGGRIAFHDGESGKPQWEAQPALEQNVWRMEFSPEGSRLAGLMEDGSLRMWTIDRASREATPVNESPPRALPSAEDQYDRFGGKLSWSPTGATLVVGNQLGHVSLWTSSGQAIHHWTVLAAELEYPPIGAAQLAWSPNGQLLFTVSRDSIQIRDARTGMLRSTERGINEIDCGNGVVAMAVHPSGHIAATGHEGTRLRMWDLSTGEMLREGCFPDTMFQQPIASVAEIEFAPDGKRIGFTTFDATYVHVIDLVTFEHVWKSDHLGAHFSERMPIRWSPDSSHLWFTYDCSRKLHIVEPKRGAKPRVVGEGYLPSFGGEVGAVADYTGAFATGFDGKRRWNAKPPVQRAR